MADHTISTRKAIAFGTTFVLLFTTALVAAAEVAVRYRERHRADVPGSMPFLFYRHARLGYALVRGMDYFGWASIDANGFRRGLPAPKSDRTIRILADGGSTTFDTFAGGDDRAWPARLQFWLNQLDPARPVEVTNAGVPGYRVQHNLIRLQTELHALRPGLIVLLQGHNDLFAALSGSGGPATAREFIARPDEIRPMSSARVWLTSHSLFFAKVQDMLNLRRAGARAGRTLERSQARSEVFEERLRRGQKEFERDLRLFLATANSLGIPVVLLPVVHLSKPTDSVPAGPDAAAWNNGVRSAPPEVVLEGYRRYNETQRMVAAELGAAFIDTSPFGIHGARYYAPNDPIHFNAEGAELMGRRLAESLLAARVLPALNGSGPARP
jgi:lysophospholipase L1-like esterase